MYSKRAIALSVLLHVAFVVLLTFSLDFSSDTVVAPTQPTNVVQARVVDQQAVEQEVKRLKASDDAVRQEQEKKTREAERKVREAEEQRRVEERRVEELKTEQERLKKLEEVERKRVADVKRKAAEEERKAEEQRKAQEQRKAEEQRAAEEQRKADEQRKAEEKKQQEAAERKRQEQERQEAERKRIEQAMQAELAAEEAAEAAAAQAAADESEIGKYTRAIYNSVVQSWTRLPGMEGLSCTLRIVLIPGGEVSIVEVVKSSGNPTFDRQAENAVRKAAPLPVPSEPRLFQKMRSISLVFKPQ